jgi:phosphatidylglycerol:prolipoprotein diacylglycerol transferase
MLALFLTGVVYIKSKQYPKMFLLDMLRKIVPILLGAAIGARLTSAITLLSTSDKPFWYNLLFGGSVFYGGIIGGCIGLAIVCVIKKQPFLEYTDVLVTLLPLGHAIGRLGCFLNGCCYGCGYEGFFSVKYPVNGEIVGVFPTWFVESAFCILLFIFFHFVYKTNIRGRRTAIYFISYSCYRFVIEFVRGDDIRGIWGMLSTSQIISVLTLLFGIIVLLYSNQKKMYNYMILRESK